MRLSASEATRAERPGGTPNPYRTSNPPPPSGDASVNSTRSTLAPRGPSRANATIASTAPGSPWNSASTVPSGQLRTQPLTPRCSALRRVVSRKNTPCTEPWTTTRLATGSLTGAMVARGASSGRLGGVQQRVDLAQVRPHAHRHRVEDRARLLDRTRRSGELGLHTPHVLHRLLRAFDLGAQRVAVERARLAAAHEHARAGQAVRDLERERRVVLGVVRDEQLVAVDLAQRARLRGQPVGRHDEHRVVGVAALARLVEVGECRVARQVLRVLGLEDDPPARRPGARVDRDEHVALLARRARRVADRVARVAAGAREPLERLVDGLLERAPLGGAALALGLELRDLLALGLELQDLLAQPDELLVHRAELRALVLRRAVERPDGHPLEHRERVLVGVRRELALEVLAHLDRDLADRQAHLVLHGLGAAVAEMAIERLRDMAVLGAEGLVDLAVELGGDLAGALGELPGEVACGALELRLDEVGVGPRLLPVEHARADLERVAHELRRIVARVEPLGDQADEALVLDRQPVDADAVAHDVDVREREWGRCFHGEGSEARASI